MPQVTIEYMILIPVLILQIFLFPYAVGLVMNTWVDSRRSLALEEAVSHIGSSIQQVYYSLNHSTILSGNLTSKLSIQPYIEGYAYTGNATLRTVLDPVFNSSQILDVTLKFKGLAIWATTSVIMGENVEWRNSTLLSNSTIACITAEKLNDTITLHFGT
jgi:hypothetical protein